MLGQRDGCRTGMRVLESKREVPEEKDLRKDWGMQMKECS